MAEHVVTFDSAAGPVSVPTGSLLTEAARLAGVEIGQPCGGQGRCGRCAVQVTAGTVRRRSALRLSPADIEAGYALACQSVIESDVSVTVPPQEEILRHVTTDRTAAEVQVPHWYDPDVSPGIHRVRLRLTPPSMGDQTDDWSRLCTALRQQAGLAELRASLPLLRSLGAVLRAGEWEVTAVVDAGRWDQLGGPARLITLQPGHADPYEPLWALAVDIGTTTVTVWLVDLTSGRVMQQAGEYNRQISRGEDVISRIIAAGKPGGAEELRDLVLETLNELIERVCSRSQIEPVEIVKATLAGNSTMIHLLLGIPAASIRLEPFVTAINQPPTLTAREVGLNLAPDATVDCLPGVASYVGADITAGVLSSGLDSAERITLFIDVGTNGEIVLGSQEWLVSCACSAGPAFEGAGMAYGMRASRGAIEEVWINAETYEPSYRVIGGEAPRGLCGSGLIALLAEMFLSGVVDKAGNVNLTLPTPRVRQGPQGPEYVVAWAAETAIGQDLAITRVDIDNLLRAKAAIYAGFVVLADSVGLTLDAVEQVLIGGSFGKYINVEKAVEIGLLPDMPWDRFEFLGNTAVRGAYLALLDRGQRERLADIASRMTYIELSADNTFYEAFTSALFLPHTDLSRFPSVAELVRG